MEISLADTAYNVDVLQIITLAILVVMFVFSGHGKRLRKIKVGAAGVELDTNGEPIDGRTPCPYTHSHGTVRSDVEKLTTKLDTLCDNDKKQEKEIQDIQGKLDSLCQDLGSIGGFVRELTADQQKQIFYSTLPLFERMIAGLRYINMGKNGDTRKDVLAMISENKTIYSTIVSLKPELEVMENE